MQLQQLLKQSQFPPEAAHERRTQIGRALRANSRYVQVENFEVISHEDLSILFDEYDRRLFSGAIREALQETELRFRLSKRMTRSGGTTTRFVRRGTKDVSHYEIAISSTLLYQTFGDVDRPVKVTGITCNHRLAALQCIFEHELVHLAEMLAWWDSNCAAARFQAIALRLFGHTDHRHTLVTARERAVSQFGIRPGSRVRFRYDGRHYEGFVNRITKRASVLVRDNEGRRYGDGNRYSCYYIPLEYLEPLA